MSVLSEKKKSVAGCSTQKNNQVLQGFKYMVRSSVKVHSNICKLQIQIMLHIGNILSRPFLSIHIHHNLFITLLLGSIT